ncbi:MAG: glycosyltransferase family 1 protein [Candidatus Levybacteria bacterium]|nr:glycosyltransferase family 1 protein [Candidatus Levybacteria bacterium]MSU25819.1 glycosyltransferase family 1 protein [Candidatus Levybacteria bacterium]
MRIGIDARLWNETGVGRYIRSLFYYLSEYDIENEYIWFLGKKEFNTLELPSKKWKKVESNIHWHTFAEQLILPWIFYREKLDLLHFPYFSFPILYPKSFVITIHDLIFDHHKTGKASTLPRWFYFIKKIGYHVVLWMSVKRSRNILTLSQDSKLEIINHYHADPDKITVTYESGKLEDSRIDFSGKEFEQMKKLQPYILYVGNAHPHKNVEMLISATKKLKQKRNIRLVLVGNDQFFYPKLIDFIASKNAQSYVSVIGSVPNEAIAAWYHFAEALVTASKMEGFGIPPLEAMSVGCPVIVSNIPVFHEVYGDAAVFFDHTDSIDIAQKIDTTLSSKILLKTLIEKGYKKSKEYSWEKTVEETAAVYKKSL